MHGNERATYVAELVEAVLHGDGDEHDDGAHQGHRPRRRRRQVPAAPAPRHVPSLALDWSEAKRSDQQAARRGSWLLVRSRSRRHTRRVSSLGGGRASGTNECALQPAGRFIGARGRVKARGRPATATPDNGTEEWLGRATRGWIAEWLAGLGDHASDGTGAGAGGARPAAGTAHGPFLLQTKPRRQADS